ncbi:MAG: protease modulator HflK [Planctomycetaceae bacterium]|nr:MAG: protease modulator HflK [Planctomycetaceae bacterium]
MTVFRTLAFAGLAAWLASGFYVIRGNEQGLVRRFGRARLPLVASGLHFELPWPLSRVDRVNLQEMRTLTLGVASSDSLDPVGFLRPAGLDRVGEFLTADKNLLNLQVHLQYRISDPYRWLCAIESPEVALRLLAESRIAEAISQSGVDYVHPLGLDELRQVLTRDLVHTVDDENLGAVVEDVTIAAVWPPLEVKAAFLDVSNARAEKEKLIEQEQSRGEQKISAARSQCRQLLDRAHADKQSRIQAARASADRFRGLLAAFDEQSAGGGGDRQAVRRRAMTRMFLETLETVWPKMARPVVLETDQPVDLRVFPGGRKPAAGSR